MDERHSEILDEIIVFIYPFILIFGFYVILYGQSVPGGGFQGGAILAAVFMSRYLVFPDAVAGEELLKTIEKLTYILIIAVVSFVLFTSIRNIVPWVKQAYLIIMNLLIGIKVCCGLSIIFFTFAHMESRKKVED